MLTKKTSEKMKTDDVLYSLSQPAQIIRFIKIQIKIEKKNFILLTWSGPLCTKTERRRRLLTVLEP